jgi:hypothetical protein
MPLSQSCKEKLQLQPSSAALLLPSKGTYQSEKKAVEFVKARNLVDNPENVVGVAMRADDRVDIARSDAR